MRERECPLPEASHLFICFSSKDQAAALEVVAFLEAVKAKDAVRLRNATSALARTEAMPKNRPLFTAILEQDLSEAALTELASTLEGYRAFGPGGRL